MAITVSDEFKAIWAEKQGKEIYQRLRYKRRYKLGGSYFQEADWKVLDRPDFVSIGAIPQQSDVRRNVIKTSSVSIKVPNENNQWIEHAGSPSFYASDSVATDGYKATRTLWQIQEGYELSSGSIEWISVFTGIQFRMPKITGKGDTAVIEIMSNAVLLEKADAEEVSDTFTLEDCTPAADGTVDEFESASTGVDHANDFQVNGASRTQGSQWRVSNDNEVASAGNTGKLLIKTDSPPTAGHAVKVSGVKWKQNNLPETLLGLLADEAGIGSGARSISPFVFPGGLSGSKTIATQAQWLAGSVFTNTEANTESTGQLKQQWFLIDDFSVDLALWSVSSGVSIIAGKANIPSAGKTMSFPTSKFYGSWEANIDPVAGNMEFQFIVMSGYYPGGSGENMYFLEVTATTIKLYRENHITPAGARSLTLLGTALHAAAASDVYQITRDSSNIFRVYKNTALVITSAADSSFASGTCGLAFTSTGSGNINNVYWGEDVMAGAAATNANPLVYESEEFDLLAAPTAWAAMTANYSLAGATIAFYTDVASAPGGPYDGYVAVNGSLIPQSALKRYVKVKIEITRATTRGILTGPTVTQAVLYFATSTIYVSLANHRGRTVMQQMEQYVKLPDYELRFKGDGTLVIGPKTSGSYVVHLTQENAILDITEVDYGIPDRVVRAARVRYQGFVSEYGDSDAGASAETIADGDELGKSVLDEDLDQVLVANDLNLGVSRARVLYENSRRSLTDPRPPVRLRLRIWDVPWLEVSDVVRISYFDHPLLNELQANDELLRAYSVYLHMGDPGNVISNAKDWRLLYYNPNKDTHQAEILVEEVL